MERRAVAQGMPHVKEPMGGGHSLLSSARAVFAGHLHGAACTNGVRVRRFAPNRSVVSCHVQVARGVGPGMSTKQRLPKDEI